MTVTTVSARIAEAGARLSAGARLCQQDLAVLLSISVKTLGRRLAAGLVPAPDAVEGGRPFWFARSVRPLLGVEAPALPVPSLPVPDPMPKPRGRRAFESATP